ncbi:MAG: hypothetical protein AAF716_13590 [Cyanobacteria bacterium P01_D01_bin.1]
MEENKGLTSKTEQQAMALEAETPLADEQLEEVAGGTSHKPVQKHFEESQNKIVSDNTTINRAHQRRLEQIDNPDLAQ